MREKENAEAERRQGEDRSTEVSPVKEDREMNFVLIRPD